MKIMIILGRNGEIKNQKRKKRKWGKKMKISLLNNNNKLNNKLKNLEYQNRKRY